MSERESIEINSRGISNFARNMFFAGTIWLFLIYLLYLTYNLINLSQSTSYIIAIILLPIIVYLVSKTGSSTYTLTRENLIQIHNEKKLIIPWNKIISIAKVYYNEGPFVFEFLTFDKKRFKFPVPSRDGKVEHFLDTLQDFLIIPVKFNYDKLTARWKNKLSDKYVYTSIGDRFMNFMYGDPNAH